MAKGLVDAFTEVGVAAVNAADPDQTLNDDTVRRLLFAVRFAQDEGDAVAVRGWLKCTAGIGVGTVRGLIDAALESDAPFVETCRNSSTPRVVAAIEELDLLAKRIRDADTFGQVLDEAEAAGLPADALLHLRGLIQALHASDKTLEGALQNLEEGDAEPEGIAEGAVSVTTFRKAKGLTAEVVVVTDLDDDVVPGDVLGEDLAEQRRLLYVTMTRARRFLHPTSYAGAGHRAPGNYRERSRFLDEVGIASQQHEGTT
jgi:superfamily I DNA/RNA helicase